MKGIVLALILSLPVLLLPGTAFTDAAFQASRVSECVDTDIPVNSAPAVRILLSGFLLVRFNGCNTPCEIGIPRAIGRHNLNIYVVKLQRDKKPEIVYSYFGPLKDALWLGVFRPKYPGVRRFGMARFDPAKADKHDFGYAVDLESAEYHGGSLQWDTDRLTPSIYITNGLFYSEMLTDPQEVSITRLCPGNKKQASYRRVATMIAADIDFDNDLKSNPIPGFASLRFGQDAKPVLQMDWDPTGATRYEMHIENEPLDPQDIKESDFQEYYRVVRNDMTGKHYDFEFPGKVTNQLPCMPGVFGGGGS
jgi:hypothetical protein